MPLVAQSQVDAESRGSRAVVAGDARRVTCRIGGCLWLRSGAVGALKARDCDGGGASGHGSVVAGGGRVDSAAQVGAATAEGGGDSEGSGMARRAKMARSSLRRDSCWAGLRLRSVAESAAPWGGIVGGCRGSSTQVFLWTEIMSM